jgi:hypothetical protein
MDLSDLSPWIWTKALSPDHKTLAVQYAREVARRMECGHATCFGEKCEDISQSVNNVNVRERGVLNRDRNGSCGEFVKESSAIGKEDIIHEGGLLRSPN